MIILGCIVLSAVWFAVGSYTSYKYYAKKFDIRVDRFFDTIKRAYIMKYGKSAGMDKMKELSALIGEYVSRRYDRRRT